MEMIGSLLVAGALIIIGAATLAALQEQKDERKHKHTLQLAEAIHGKDTRKSTDTSGPEPETISGESENIETKVVPKASKPILQPKKKPPIEEDFNMDWVAGGFDDFVMSPPPKEEEDFSAEQS